MADRRELDDTDLEILDLLIDDARRSYREIADAVDLSPPAVSDRIDRLVDQGIIRRFTVDIDRRIVQGRTPLLLELDVPPSDVQTAYDAVHSLDGIEHVYRTVDGTIVAHAHGPANDVESWLETGLADIDVIDRRVRLLAASEWNPELTQVTFSLTCVVCGNSVDEGGMTATFDGEPKAFCCPSCKAAYTDRYETLKEQAE